MLVLTRKKGQQIILGDNVKITVLEINDDSIKIGICAPKEVSILRSELYLEVKQENRNAANSENTSLDKLKHFFKSPKE